MQFLGTAAADVLPGPLCDCAICNDARKDPARGRLRSSFLLDERNLIDCGPDFAAAIMRHGLNAKDLRNIFITHTHEDHFEPSNAGLIKFSKTRPTEPVDVYLSWMAYDSTMKQYELLKDAFPGKDSIEALNKGLVRLHSLKAGERYRVDGYEVMPVNTTHQPSKTETAYNYLFQKDGRSLLYACDTGYYLPEALEMLENVKLDILIMEGTWGNRTDRPTTAHMNAFSFVDQLHIFMDRSIIRDDTRIYCTHINHKHDLNHEQYQAWFREHTDLDVTVAYDGLKIDW